jgi:hypothetical protein
MYLTFKNNFNQDQTIKKKPTYQNTANMDKQNLGRRERITGSRT